MSVVISFLVSLFWELVKIGLAVLAAGIAFFIYGHKKEIVYFFTLSRMMPGVENG